MGYNTTLGVYDNTEGGGFVVTEDFRMHTLASIGGLWTILSVVFFRVVWAQSSIPPIR